MRRGVMELYLSDHPLDCLTSPAAGNCEFQEMAGLVGVREVRYGHDGANHLHAAGRRLQSIFPVRSGALHRLLALRACVRGSAGHLRADRRRPRLRLEDRGRHGRAVPDQRMRLLRRLRAGLPDRVADREDRGRTRPARAFGRHHLRLLRRRLQLQGGDAGRHRGAHGAVEGRQGEPRTFLRQGPLRLGLRQPPGPHPEADGAREDHRSVARSDLGRGDRPRRHPSSGASRQRHGKDSIGVITSSRCTDEETYLVQKLARAGVRQQQHRYLRPGLPLADRLRAEHDLRHLGRHAGFRLRSSRPT